MHVEFITVDVFTDRQFGGNPLAVVLNADELTTERMQSIAAEFNLSETTFVLPPKQSLHTAEVRIFTPRAEIPFAGHPNIGTAYALATLGSGYGTAESDTLVFEERAGLVRLDLIRDAVSIVGARLTAPQPLLRGEEIAPEIVAAACSIGVDDIETANHHPCLASSGMPFVFVELKTRGSLAAAQPRPEIFSEHVPANRATGIHLYVYNGEISKDIQARMFAPLLGVPEDPATGSANVTLAGLVASMRPESDLSLELRITQGVDMGRPSVLVASAEKRSGQITEMRIGGRCVPMMKGTLELIS